MSKAVGWTLIVLLVVLLGTHPSTVVGLLDHFLAILDRAGEELSSFLSSL
ncbi:MAG TPA: hypothetical protein VEJ42_00165 [Streptosporangiaceae bacterium]|nr:hypothetical protein [Streptosporangiaceae bacterium]